MQLPPPSKAQEELFSDYRKAKIRFVPGPDCWAVQTGKDLYVGFGRDWFSVGKNDKLKKVSPEMADGLNDLVSIFTREALRDKKDNVL